MTYYFISGARAKLRDFLNRFPMLSDATEIKGPEQISRLQSAGTEQAIFFIDLQSLSVPIQGLIFTVRERLPLAKLIYVTDDKNAHDLKVHQKSPIGGDAYVPFEIKAAELNGIVESLVMISEKSQSQSLNRLDQREVSEFDEFSGLMAMKNHPLSGKIDELFKNVIKVQSKKPVWQSAEALVKPTQNDDLGVSMSIKDQELSLEDAELEISIEEDEPQALALQDDGLDLSFEADENLELSADNEEIELGDSASEPADDFGELSLDEEEGEELLLGEDDGEELSLGEEESLENLDELSFGNEAATVADNFGELNLSDDGGLDDLNLTAEPSLELGQDLDLGDEELSLSEGDMSDDAMAKLKEIDAIMDYDASQVAIRTNPLPPEDPLDEPLVSDDLNLDSLNFSSDEIDTEEEEVVEEKPKKKKKEVREVREARDLGQDLRDISGAYSGEMERTQATISNLRSDREELLARIQKLEEERMMQNRQTLSIRAELDEKKIELTIIRKKLNEEITDLKDRLKLFDEKRLIIEEKNRILAQELDKAAQKNKIDVKKVQMRERELEQRLELLKADAESQIRHRDLKILELKRKIDAMEFDMESISVQEKRSVESRFELEDKLEKAIKTLRSAITVLEDESDRTNALDALKKNIDM